ncbi:unnamed protein product [Schistosoma rodhaini]|uniref:Uncharacterized protein n=1 Tax=Schistosoma rodhaini TaxID=6188 RepID=A0AA85FCS6_9TREM|nr:unnamed protein product [Schistosoma rodhaini]
MFNYPSLFIKSISLVLLSYFLDPVEKHKESYSTELNSNQIRIEPNQQVTSIGFYNKASAIALLQLLIIWGMNLPFILIETLKEWLRSTNWFVGLCFFSGLFIDLEMALVPQVQFKFPWNYILLSMIISIPASRSLSELDIIWFPSSWGITLGITLLTLLFGGLKRFDIKRSFNIFFIVIFTLQAVVYVVLIVLNHFHCFNVILIISGFGMLLTIIYELAIATQAIFPGSVRFGFRDDQYFLYGLVLATIMIWMNMIISSEISLIQHVSKNVNQCFRKEQMDM